MNDDAAIHAYPVLAGLAMIKDAGWSFLHRSVVDGVPTQIDGFRAWPDGWIDAIRVLSETDAMALRTNGDEPPGLVWERTGTLADVIEGLLGLPMPDDRLSPRLVRAKGPMLWTP
ncbi:hypothetical protein [Crossiella sp. CA198]|uniref:hypothetical protein n=1 Tax=Crossiella sp. CA198 TaxID=3455607 RepID=UPI003F8D2C55